MAFDYQKSAATALKLLKQFGRKAVIRRPSTGRGEYDPVEGKFAEPEGDELQGEFDLVVLPASKGTIEAFDNRLEEGLTAAAMRYLIIAAASAPFEPQAMDVVAIDGAEWIFMGCTPLDPAGGSPVIYKAGVKRR